MGKQAKKKQKTEAQLKGQKRHNAGTRGVNTKKLGALWAIRQVPLRNKKGEVKKDDEGNVLTREVEVRVPVDAGYDMFAKYDKNSPEPFDSCTLDWRQEVMEFCADNGARVAKIDKGDGVFAYRVYRDEPNPKGKGMIRNVLFEIESTKRFTLEKERKPVRK